MTEGEAPSRPYANAELEALARDWITIWQSEFAALAGDREMREAWQKLVAHRAGAVEASLAAPALPSSGAPDERADGRARPDAAPRPAAAAAAFDARELEIERLRTRVAHLEHRLAELEPERRFAGNGSHFEPGNDGGDESQPA